MRNLLRLPAFAHPDTVHVIVESPRGATVKLKYDMALGAMSISRPLSLGLSFPYDWGFVPSTLGADGDPLDAVVLWDVSTYPGVVISCHAVALIKVEQQAGENRRIRNDRLILRPLAARRESELPSAAAISPRVRAELAAFLLASTALEGKDAQILGWDGPEAVIDLIRASLVEGES